MLIPLMSSMVGDGSSLVTPALAAKSAKRQSLVIASLTENASTTDGPSVATASISPTLGGDIYAAVVSRCAAAANQPTATGNGLTYTALQSQLFTTDLTRLTVFHARVTAVSAGAITFDFGGQTQTSFVWHIVQLTNTPISDTATRQSVAAGAGSAQTSQAVSLSPTIGHATNIMLAFHAIALNSTITPDANFTQLAASRGVAANVISLLASYALGRSTSTATFASAQPAAVAVEVVPR